MELDYEESGDGFLASVRYLEQKMVTTKKSTTAINGGVNDLLEVIVKEPGHRIPYFIQHIPSASRRTIQRWLAELTTQGLIEFRGSYKKGGYFLK